MKRSTGGVILFAGAILVIAVAYLLTTPLDGPLLVGVLFGAALGGFNILVSYMGITRALSKGQTAVVGMMLGGFFARLTVLVLLVLYFQTQPWVNEVAFAVSFMVFFCVFMAIEIHLVQRSLNGSRNLA